MGFIEMYGLLAGIGILWAVLASIEDWKTTEISNWLTFSLIGFGLAYRGFYALSYNDAWFFVSGLIGFGVFFVLAHLFYYARVFGGGDAKLLMGLGVVLPYGFFNEMIYVSIGFLLLFLAVSALYSIVSSGVLIYRHWKCFEKIFLRKLKIWKKWLFVSILFVFAIMYLGGFELAIVCGGVLIGILPLVYVCVKALDECMIAEKKPNELIEGDWLVKDVFVRGKTIKKSVHGLSLEDIKLLRRANKKVLIKEGVVFAPVFLISLVVEFCLAYCGISFMGFG